MAYLLGCFEVVVNNKSTRYAALIQSLKHQIRLYLMTDIEHRNRLGPTIDSGPLATRELSIKHLMVACQLLILMLVLTALGVPEPSWTQAVSENAPARAAPSPNEQCYDREEAQTISQTDGRVTRDGCVLTFHGSMKEVTLTSSPCDCDAVVMYRYLHVIPEIQFDVVEISYWEGNGYMIISPIGSQRQIIGPPVLSPDQHRLLATSIDLRSGYNPNGLEIFNVERGYSFVELSLRTDQWGPTDAVWIDADTIEFTQILLDDKGLNEYTREGARLRRTLSGWSFEPAEP